MNPVLFVHKNLDDLKTAFYTVFFVAMIEGIATFFVPVVIAEFTKANLTVQKAVIALLILLGIYSISLFCQWM